MTFPDFDALVEKVFDQLRGLRKTKGKEYANSATDRLANFKEIAADYGVSPECVLLIYSDKHTRAIQSFVKNNCTYFSNETIESRIVDRIMYDFLLLGLIHERRENEKRNSRVTDVEECTIDERIPPKKSGS